MKDLKMKLTAIDLESTKVEEINNFDTNIFIEGDIATGKSVSLIKPIIYQSIEKKLSTVIFDLKENLAKFSFNLLKERKEENRFKYFSIDSIEKSNRINIFRFIKSTEDIKIFVESFFGILNPHEFDFWKKQHVILFTLIIHRLYNSNEYREQGLFTLPHAIAIVKKHSVEKILAWVYEDEKLKSLYDWPLKFEIFKQNKMDNLCGGVGGTLQVMLSKIAGYELFYFFNESEKSKHNIDINISDYVICISGSSGKNNLLEELPLILLDNLVKKYSNVSKKENLIIDEFSTINKPLLNLIENLTKTFENKKNFVVACQNFDFSMIKDYEEKIEETKPVIIECYKGMKMYEYLINDKLVLLKPFLNSLKHDIPVVNGNVDIDLKNNYTKIMYEAEHIVK